MAGLWDNLMKRLVGANPEHFLNWLVGQATFVAMLDNELKSQNLFADALLHMQRRGRPELLHIEFQTYSDSEMGQRCWTTMCLLPINMSIVPPRPT